VRETQVLNLAECAELSRTLQAPPRRFVHGLVWLLIGLLGTAVGWAGFTRMDLVVRASGRVRPLDTATKIFNPVRGDVLSGSSGGRVAEVHFHEGDEVKKGDVLLRFNTERLDNEIVKLKRTIQVDEGELSGLERERDLLARQFSATRAKGEEELAQATEELRQAKVKQASEQRSAQTELLVARDELARQQRLMSSGALARSEYVKSQAREQEAKEQLARAEVALNESKPKLAQLALVLAEKEQALKQQELEGRQRLKQAAVEKARSELTNLELELSQAILIAPVDGVVTDGDVKVGDVIGPGQRVLEIAEQKGFRFEVLVLSEEVGHLQVGMPVRIKLDAFDYQKYGTVSGTVGYISPDSVVAQEPQSAGGPVGPTASRGQRAAAFLVKIDLDSDAIGFEEVRSKIKLGMLGQAEIVTDHETLLFLLLKKIRQSISLG
jgi:hemolysin D